MNGITTVQLEKATKKKLERFKDYKRETFDDVINKLMRQSDRRAKSIYSERLSSALLSEKALAKDWLSKKEEKAWKNL